MLLYYASLRKLTRSHIALPNLLWHQIGTLCMRLTAPFHFSPYSLFSLTASPLAHYSEPRASPRPIPAKMAAPPPPPGTERQPSAFHGAPVSRIGGNAARSHYHRRRTRLPREGMFPLGPCVPPDCRMRDDCEGRTKIGEYWRLVGIV